MISFSDTPAPNAFEVDAPRNECAENFEISIPDKNKTCFSHLAKVQEVTA